MPLDTFICGTCMVSFNDIEQFILHKNDMCGKVVETSGIELVQENATSESISATSVVADMSQVSVQGSVDIGKSLGWSVC